MRPGTLCLRNTRTHYRIRLHTGGLVHTASTKPAARPPRPCRLDALRPVCAAADKCATGQHVSVKVGLSDFLWRVRTPQSSGGPRVTAGGRAPKPVTQIFKNVFQNCRECFFLHNNTTTGCSKKRTTWIILTTITSVNMD